VFDAEGLGKGDRGVDGMDPTLSKGRLLKCGRQMTSDQVERKVGGQLELAMFVFSGYPSADEKS
jgi:hypothetical protein